MGEMPLVRASGAAPGVALVVAPSDAAPDAPDAEHASSDAATSDAALDAVRAERPDDECVVCLEYPKAIFFFPCNHLCLCLRCAEKWTSDLCPMCRGRGGKQRIYLS